MYIFCFSLSIITIQLLFIETLRYFTICSCYLTLLFTVLSTIPYCRLRSFWLSFDSFLITFWWLSSELTNQNMGTVDGRDVKLSNSSLTLVGVLKVSTCKCLKLATSRHSLICHLKWQLSKVVKKMSKRFHKVKSKCTYSIRWQR